MAQREASRTVWTQNRSTPQRWSVAAIVASAALTLAWLVAAAWQGPRYSVLAHSISDMYAEGAPKAWVLIVVLTLCGVATMGFAGLALWPSLRRGGWAAMVGSVCLALSVFGLGDLLSPFEREGCRLADAGCTPDAATATFGGSLDATLTTFGFMLLVAAGFFLAAAMDNIAAWQAWVRPTQAVTIVVLVLFILAGIAGPSWSGLAERLVAVAGAAAIAALAVGVLSRSRTPAHGARA